MHVKHLLIDNETMSKSKGNFFTIPDLVARGHKPEAIRYLLAGAHYRKPLNFGFEGLQQAAAALERIHGLVSRLDEIDGAAGPGRGRPRTWRRGCREAFDARAGGRPQHAGGAGRGSRPGQPGERLLAEGS